MTSSSCVRLSDIVESIDYGVTASAINQPRGPKFLRITDIQNGAVNWRAVPWCECNSDSAASAQLKAGDIVFARTGATTGKSFLIRDCPPNTVFASYLIRVRLGQAADSRYVAHFFNTREYWNQISAAARGVAQPGVNATTLKNLRVPLPPIDRQRRVADVLDRADALRARRRAALVQLGTLAKAIFLERFGEPATNPKNWPVVTVGQVADVQGGLQLSASRKTLPIEVPYLRVANVYRDALDLRHIKTMRVTDGEAQRTRLLRGDLLIVEGHGNADEIGRAAQWDGSIENCVHQNHLIRVRFDVDCVNATYASQYLNSPGGRRHLIRSAKTTSGLNTISVSQVRMTPLALPPLELQAVFAQRVESVLRLRIAQESAATKFDCLFSSLQHRAFRDEL